MKRAFITLLVLFAISQVTRAEQEELLFELPQDYEFVFDRPMIGLTTVMWSAKDVKRATNVLVCRLG